MNSTGAALKNLVTPGSVEVVSNADLLRRVRSALPQQQALSSPALKQVRTAPHVGTSLTTTPLETWHTLGRVNAMKPTTLIGKLRALAYVIFYLDVLQVDTTGNLHLCEDAGDWFRGNERAKLSEDLGSALGIIAAQEWCRRGRKVSVSPVLISRRQLLPKNHTFQSGKEPDVLLEVTAADGTGSPEYYLLETKGRSRQSGEAQPLARAVEQLASFTINNTPVEGLATCTVAQDAMPIMVYTIDPEAQPFSPREELRFLPWHRGYDLPEPSGRAGEDLDPEAVSRFAYSQILRAKYEGIRALGGEYEGRRGERRDLLIGEPMSPTRFSAMGFDWQGRQIALPGSRHRPRLILRIGAEEPLLNAVREGGLEGIREHEQRYRSKLADGYRSESLWNGVWTPEPGEDGFVYHASPDGTILGVGIHDWWREPWCWGGGRGFCGHCDWCREAHG